MKHISIKIFTFLIIGVFLIGELIIFYSFYKDAKHNIENLLESNIQTQILNLKHYINANIKANNINPIVSDLDNIINTNILFNDMHIITDKGTLLYATDRSTMPYHPSIDCTPIAQIDNTDIFKQKCYSFSIKLFNKLNPYYYTNIVYINDQYIDSLLLNQIKKFTMFFILFVLVFSFVLWMIIKVTLIKPLEELRRFAYYSRDIPRALFIKELESIRYSLRTTFKRLKREQEELYKLSTKDSLSGLYNRHSLMEKIDWFISQSKRSGEKFALLFIDLDNFKNINDTVGHEYGDVVLQHVSKILLESVRENDIVSRPGGDEFIILLADIKETLSIVEIIQRINKKLSEPIIYHDFTLHITVSIGITIYPEDGENMTQLLKNADIAMYKAKELGKNHYHFFTEELEHAVEEKMKIHQHILDALEHNYFELYYQPKIDIKTQKIIACEALIRLIHPKVGMIAPDKFISIAEDTGLIVQIGKWVIDQGVRQLQLWSQTDLKDISLSVNISALQLQDDNFINYLQNAIKDIDSSKLDIELTESALISSFDTNLEKLNEIKALNLSLSLDDFGTGYSSLSYLKTIPFDTLKIDKTFIDDIATEDGKSFVEMIVKIAQTLHLKVVAEGVETQDQLQYLQDIECDQYQGYYCSKPLPVKDFQALFHTKKCN